jgi:hypothetical protein
VLAAELIVADDVDGLAFGEELALSSLWVGCAEDAICKFDDGAAEQSGAGLDLNLVVVAGRGAIAAAGFNHGENALMLGFKLAVSEAEGAEQLDAAYLKPDQIIRVVDDAHLVGFGIADADFGSDGHIFSGQ